MKKYDFTVLSENTIDHDYGEDKTHEKVAETLLNTILEYSQKGLTIGLEGAWGSGKSTVVSILQQKILKKNNIRFIYFDAWVHEGDPLRRVFFDSFIEQIQTIDNEVQQLRDKINLKCKTTKSTTTNKATGLGKKLFFTTLLVPLGTMLTGLYVKNGIYFSIKDDIDWVCVFLILLSVSPLVFLIVYFFILVYKKFIKKTIKKIRDPSNWLIMQSEIQNETQLDIRESYDRSSIEFEQDFELLLSHVCNDGQNHKIVLVIDNLDRINTSEALQIWATLQTFVQNRNPIGKIKKGFENLWIIVPYDYDALKKILDTKQGNVKKNTDFDKFFQLRIDVPAFTISSWEKYCSFCIESAMKHWSNEDKRIVENVLKISRSNFVENPTPREIKVYINQVCLLRNHCFETISLEAVCYYVIIKYIEKYENRKIIEYLQQDNIPESHVKTLLSANVRNEIAGLIFNVDPSRGVQILLEEKIKELIKNGNMDGLIKLEEDYDIAFWSVLDHYLVLLDEFDKLLDVSYILQCCFYVDKLKSLSNFIQHINSWVGKTSNIILYYEVYVDQMASFISLLDKCTKKNESNFDKFFDMLVLEFEKELDRRLDIDKINLLNQALELYLGQCTKHKLKKYELKNTTLLNWIYWMDAKQYSIYTKFKPKKSILNDLPQVIDVNQSIPINLTDCLIYFNSIGMVTQEQFVQIGKLIAIQFGSNFAKHQMNFFNMSFINMLLLCALFSRETLLDIFMSNSIYLFCSDQNLVTSRIAIAAGLVLGEDLFKLNFQGQLATMNGIRRCREFWTTKNDDHLKIYSDNLFDVFMMIKESSFIEKIAFSKKNTINVMFLQRLLKENNNEIIKMLKSEKIVSIYISYFGSDSNEMLQLSVMNK